ncbi:MAG: hypothetical protein RDV48_10055 [Candidatus Eremiobacteraeota bacterium]|nr:hypothetical protein [Candidatus Eremiobacteraeota bacterium]
MRAHSILQMMLDSLERYIDAPSQEKMAETLDLLLQSMGHIRTINTMLDKASG